MPAYCSAMVTASSHGAAFGGAYTATLDAFSSGTASMLLASISPRTAVNALSTGSVRMPLSAASRRNASRSGMRNRSEEHTSELQSRQYLVCRLLLEKKNYNALVMS